MNTTLPQRHQNKNQNWIIGLMILFALNVVLVVAAYVWFTTSGPVSNAPLPVVLPIQATPTFVHNPYVIPTLPPAWTATASPLPTNTFVAPTDIPATPIPAATKKPKTPKPTKTATPPTPPPGCNDPTNCITSEPVATDLPQPTDVPVDTCQKAWLVDSYIPYLQSVHDWYSKQIVNGALPQILPQDVAAWQAAFDATYQQFLAVSHPDCVAHQYETFGFAQLLLRSTIPDFVRTADGHTVDLEGGKAKVATAVTLMETAIQEVKDIAR